MKSIIRRKSLCKRDVESTFFDDFQESVSVRDAVFFLGVTGKCRHQSRKELPVTVFCSTFAIVMQDTKVIREILPMSEHDFMCVADHHKQKFDHLIHQHDVFELNFVAGATGCRRIVGDSSEIVENLITVSIIS